MGLLATVVLLFGFQAQTILDKPLVIVLIAIPLLIQSYGIFAIAYGWGYFMASAFQHCRSCGHDWHVEFLRVGGCGGD